MENKIKIGLIGLGTVGSGVFKTLRNFGNVEVVKIAVRNKNKKETLKDWTKVLLQTILTKWLMTLKFKSLQNL